MKSRSLLINTEKQTPKIIAAVMAIILFFSAVPVNVLADGEAAPEKYVSDVYIAYAKTEEEAVQRLIDNGWEPISGNNDFNAGKASFWDNSAGHRDNVAAALGIKRTKDAGAAITDMAVMNMTGGYSIPDYEDLLNEKKSEIDEFINSFLPAIQEFRDNYNGNGSEYGKRRADLANMVLNRLYDGEPGTPEAANDTGLPIGDLLRQPLRQEGNESGGDLQQILLESTGAAVSLIELMMALSADAGKESWIERLQGLSGDSLRENLSLYVPEAAGQDVAPSAAEGFLKQHYGDAAETIAKGWSEVHDTLAWYETYSNANDLRQHDGEDDTAYAERLNSYFGALSAANEDEYNRVIRKFNFARKLSICLYETEYQGEWGETLGDFFNPADGTDYSLSTEYFLPFAAAMSQGQRASLNLVSLSTLLLAGIGNEAGMELVMPDLNELFGGSEAELSVYSGINRSIFRGGVAITSEALMEQNMGRGNSFDRIWDHLGLVSIVSYVSATVGLGMVMAGGIMMSEGVKFEIVPANDVSFGMEYIELTNELDEARQCLRYYENAILKRGGQIAPELYVTPEMMEEARTNVARLEAQLEPYKGADEYKTVSSPTKVGYAGRVMLAIGGVLMAGAAVLKGVQMAKYYNRTFSPIPLMIVDQADIVTWLEDEDGKPLLDENGNQLKNIDFKDYQYYEAVRCNRQEAGDIGDPQDGVDEYPEWGCGDVADLNADMGQEWLALYTVKSPEKGNPILADSLVLQYGSDSQPKGTSKFLHFFEYSYPADLGDTAYAYNNKKEGVYFFWESDENAYASHTASAFTRGHLAMAATGGLILGVLVTTLILLPRRKKEKKS